MVKRRRTRPAGRIPRPPALTKRNIVSVGFSDAEIRTVKAEAQRQETPLTQFVREATLAWITTCNVGFQPTEGEIK